ncbi:MAG: hypothetical protein LUC25_07670 [Ruminococcus sp.]|nr:hypothetical protein [Ruminococcus sp.]
MLSSVYTELSSILKGFDFTCYYSFADVKYEAHKNTKFAVVSSQSASPVGRGISSGGVYFEGYEAKIKIDLYFLPSEGAADVQTQLDSILQLLYEGESLNIVNLSLSPISYSTSYKCLQGGLTAKISYLLEETT